MNRQLDMRKEIRGTIDRKIAGFREVEDDQLQALITQEVLDYGKQHYLSIAEKEELILSIYNSMRRMDILQPYLEDDTISEIMINGPECIFIEKGGQMERAPQVFESPETLENLIHNVVSKVNRAVNETSPIVDARLEDGSRVNVVLPPIALQGPVMTIRKFPKTPLTIEDLIERESVTREAAGFLAELVRCRYNVFISGGTSSGKTTFLNILSNDIPPQERIVTIEDSAELQIHGKENLISLESRNHNGGGQQVAIRDLIKTALRLRPDRIIVGEVRGKEALDMLQAMNTGHEGSLSTGHANSCGDILKRLEVMALEAADIPICSVRQQIGSAIEIIVQLKRHTDGTRRVMEICEVVGVDREEYVLNPLFVYDHNERRMMRQSQLVNRDKLQVAGSAMVC